MSRAAPFLVDDLLPEGVRLRAIRPVNCRRIPEARSVAALALRDGDGRSLARRLATLGEGVTVLVAVETPAAADEAVRLLAGQDLSGLVLVLDAQPEVDWIGRLRALAGRLVPQAPPAVQEPVGADALRYLAKMRELEALIDPDAAQDAPSRGRPLADARSWHSRLHARAVARFLHGQGRASQHAVRLLDRTAVPRATAPGTFRALWSALDAARPSASLGQDEIEREEALLDGFIAQEKARQAALVRPAPWRGHRRLSAMGLRA
ncbi:hypothetical protein ORIO_10270 [Cereibacter azotoformans]|uniref:hypothetical protein n=1 Tax=Cereibacter azotoformans TaxID=43057 RepID=UPI001EEA6E4D|nr:hypothetical protein [Cereibacter azotoformans]ULB10282.1 hypothetical protein ORIO_10270 [Cereibacter azotoformans]